VSVTRGNPVFHFVCSRKTSDSAQQKVYPVVNARLRNVNSLRLCLNNFSESMAAGSKDLLAAEATSLKELSLSGSRRWNMWEDQIILGLCKNRSLKTIDFGDCQISDELGSELVGCLNDHPHLDALDMSNNRLGPRTLRALCDLIPSTLKLGSWIKVFKDTVWICLYLLLH
jgi:Ran GTPase-activating protein (RanGAP) involved in mRNA processing and transport